MASHVVFTLTDNSRTCAWVASMCMYMSCVEGYVCMCLHISKWGICMYACGGGAHTMIKLIELAN